MALFTTLITTPLVMLLYPYKLMVLDQNARFEKFTAMFCVQNKSEAFSMLPLAKAIYHTGPDNHLCALRIVEITQRPSVYMPHEDLVDDVLAIFDSGYKKMKIELIHDVSHNIKDDIVHIAKTKMTDILIITTRHHHGLKGGTVKYLLKEAPTLLGVLFTQDEHKDDYHTKRIFMPYWGDMDFMQLKFGRKLSKQKNASLKVLPLLSTGEILNDQVLQHSLVKKYIALVEPEGYSKRDSLDLASHLDIPNNKKDDLPHAHSSSVSPLTSSDMQLNKEPTHSENQELALIIQHLRQTEYDFIIIGLHNNIPIIEGLLARLTVPMLVIKYNGDKKQFEDQIADMTGKLSVKERFLRKIGLKKSKDENFVSLSEHKEKGKDIDTMTEATSKEGTELVPNSEEKQEKFPIEPLILED